MRAQPAFSSEGDDHALLLAALGSAVSRRFGSGRSIVELRRLASDYRTSFAIEELRVTLDDGTPLDLIFKDVTWHALTAEAREVKPQFLYDPLREIETYKCILDRSKFGTAEFYASLVDRSRDRYWLVIEKVAGVELYQLGDLTAWQTVARALARMHAIHIVDTDFVSQASHLLHYDGDFYRRWLDRAIRFSAHCGRKKLELISRCYEAVIERLQALPQSFIHGEFYASNILVCPTESEMRVCPIDWEMAGIGAGLIDVAALTGGKWKDEERQAIALAYREQMQAPPTVDVFLELLECCRLLQCVQWLGWARNWSPPAEYAQDWLAEAVRVADKLRA